MSVYAHGERKEGFIIVILISLSMQDLLCLGKPHPGKMKLYHCFLYRSMHAGYFLSGYTLFWIEKRLNDCFIVCFSLAGPFVSGTLYWK